MLRAQTYSIGGGRCSGCEPSSGVVHELLVLLLLWRWVWSWPTINREPTRCSRLAEHALHPGAVAARLGAKQRPRAARAEAARAGRWWPWLDSNGVTSFVQQCDRGTCCKLTANYSGSSTNLLYKYGPGIRGTCGLRILPKKMKCLFLPKAAHKILWYTRTRKFKNEVTKQKGQKRVHFWTLKILHNKRP